MWAWHRSLMIDFPTMESLRVNTHIFFFIKFTGKPFNNEIIKVELAQRERNAYSRGGRGGRGKELFDWPVVYSTYM